MTVTKSVLEHDCSARQDTLTAVLLRTAGCRLELAKAPSGEMELVREDRLPASDGPTFQLVGLPLPKLDSPDKVERALLGVDEPIVTEAGKVLGLFNNPSRLRCKVDRMDSLAVNVVRMIRWAVDNKWWGPFALVHSPRVEEEDIRQVKAVEGIATTVSSPLLATGRMGLVQLTPDVVRLVVMADRIVPQVRADFRGNVGFVEAVE